MTIVAGPDDAGDTLIAGSGDVTIEGGRGPDKIYGGSGPTTVHLGSGDETITGGSGAMTIEGGSNGAVYDITAGRGSTAITLAGNGADRIDAGAGNDTITATATTGAVTISLAGASAVSHDLVKAGAGRDTIIAGRGRDTIVGGPNDTILDGTGNSTIRTAMHDVVRAASAGTADIYLGHYGERFTEADFGRNHSSAVNYLFDFNQLAGDRLVVAGETVREIIRQSHVTGGNTLIHLGDGSKIVLVGITHLTDGFFL